MNYYPHHIGDFNSATRYLTRVERSLYRDLIELYYDTEQPLPSVDFDRLARRVIAVTDEEKRALQFVLDEFFDLDGDVYRHDRCDEEIEKYRRNNSAKARAGKASAEARKKKRDSEAGNKKAQYEQNLTDDEHVLNGCATNQEPRTKNQEPIKDMSEEKPPDDTRKHSDDDLRFAEGMYNSILRIAPKTKPPNFDKWADTIRLMRERDGHTHSEMAQVFRFANADEFWRTNILSPDTLRKQYAKLDAKMRSNSNEKRNGTSAERWAIDHDDTSWLTGASGSGDSGTCEPDFSGTSGDMYGLEKPH